VELTQIQQAYGWMNRPVGSLPNTERFAQTIGSLAMQPNVAPQVKRVCQIFKFILSGVEKQEREL
jgi:hypothetical protein